jgi:CrcB protein
MTAGTFIAVGIGAALGAWARWGLSALLNGMHAWVPLGTLAANLIGGFGIGVAIEAVARQSLPSEELRLFVITGFLGALTTFSTFSAEVVELLSQSRYGWAAVVAVAHLAGSLLATVLGMACVRSFAG